jgi:uncharacterized membrane protein YgcG
MEERNNNRDNSGALFKNDRKEKESQPDYKGSVTINGVEYWQSAWINVSRDGKTYMSQKFEPKQANSANGQSTGQYGAGGGRGGDGGVAAHANGKNNNGQYGGGGAGQQRNPPRGTPPAQPAPTDFDDDIPF